MRRCLVMLAPEKGLDGCQLKPKKRMQLQLAADRSLNCLL
jgi:hypothetical protein